MSELINKRLVKLNLEANTKEEAIKELAKLMDQEERLNSYEDYITEVLRRENLSTTGIGFGIAIPHGKCAAVNIPTVAFGRKANGIEWQSLDEQPAKIVFILGVPEAAASNEHLKILAVLSRKLMNEDFREALLSIEEEDKLMDLLNEVFQSVME
ncbi:PTS sugar transporter subunit IIA [Alkaliphilus crotonatoxidans]